VRELGGPVAVGTLGRVFTPRTLDVAMVSFEGPDPYSQAGGLGVRAKGLCGALAMAGFRTSLYFVGDPDGPREEIVDGLRLVRVCQEVSDRHRAGVYDGEHTKIEAMGDELPALLIERSVRPAAADGRVTAIMLEEWQTAALAERLDHSLRKEGLRDSCVLLWNANNHFGFDTIDWRALERAATVTTVSRYMKHLMWPHGVNPIVIPNGISAAALRPVDGDAVAVIRAAAQTPCLAFKLGRFSPDKRWHQSLDAIAVLRAEGMPARLLMRGGAEPFGNVVLAHARNLGLDVAEWDEPVEHAGQVARSLAETGGVAVVNLRHFLPEAVIPAIAAASTAVLANSGHEPFGLVGLEAMAAGGVALVGATGEEYARPYGNAIVVETAEAGELASSLGGLVERPELARRLRAAARRDAAEYAWPEIVDGLLERMRYVAACQQVPARLDDRSSPIEVREIALEATRDLRVRVLRAHRPDTPATSPEDGLKGTWHLGAFAAGRLVGVVSGFAEEAPQRPGVAAQRFRFMAVDPSQQRRGVGVALMRAVIARARARGDRLLWAKGRDTALDFYTGLGFEVLGDGFIDSPSELPHHLVVLEL